MSMKKAKALGITRALNVCSVWVPLDGAKAAEGFRRKPLKACGCFAAGSKRKVCDFHKGAK